MVPFTLNLIFKKSLMMIEGMEEPINGNSEDGEENPV